MALITLMMLGFAVPRGQ